jgi:hypothetical protein
LRRAHLLEPQAGLDEAADAEVVPAIPFRPVPGKRGDLALVGIEARQQFARGGQQVGGRGKPGVGRRSGRVGQGGDSEQRAAGEHDATAVGEGET